MATGRGGGGIRNRSGDPYKPSARRSYERAMRLRILPAIGTIRLADLRRPDLQDLVDWLLSEGLDPSTIRCTVLPLRDLPPRREPRRARRQSLRRARAGRGSQSP
jgi:Phage integrase, N-terminal SAM-like domain